MDIAGSSKRRRSAAIVGDPDVEDDDECGDVEAWDMMKKSFNQVQSVLDYNKKIINQVNENHRSKVPDNIVRNVALIRELNGNMSRVLDIYSNLSANFSNIVLEKKSKKSTDEGCSGSKGASDDQDPKR